MLWGAEEITDTQTAHRLNSSADVPSATAAAAAIAATATHPSLYFIYTKLKPV